MSFVNLSGVLLDPSGAAAVGDEVRFIQKSTEGETIKTARSVITVPVGGAYDFDLQFGDVEIGYRDVDATDFTKMASVTVDGTTTATTIPELIGQTVPTTDANLITFQQMLADMITARDNAEASAEEAEEEATALFNSNPFNLNPVVYIPFNDSMRMKRGFGNLDSNNKRAVDFTRASTSGNINKSSITESVAVDEPIISIDGIGSFASFTNSLLESETLDQSPWVEVNSVVLSQDGTLSSDGSSQAWKIDGVAGSDFIRQNVSGFPLNGESVLMYQEVKAGSSNIALVTWYEYTGGTNNIKNAEIDLTTGVVTGDTHDYIEVQELNDGWWAVWFANVTNNTGNTLSRIDLGNGDVSASGYIYASKCMIVDNFTGVKLPYVATTIAVTRAEDNTSIQSLNNLPANGKDFTIICDCSVPTDYDLGVSTLFRIGTNAAVSGFTARREVGNLSLSFILADGTSSYTSTSPTVDGALHRFAFRYKDGIATAFVDGVSAISSASFNLVYDFNDQLYIARHPTFGWLNSYIKNFRIIHTGLTDDQILALGAAA